MKLHSLMAMSTSDYNSTWDFVMQLSVLFAALVVANVLRRKVPFIKKSLLPSAVIGGLLLFIIKFIPPVQAYVDSTLMEIISYHCLALGFISMSLRTGEKKREGQGMTVMKTGATVVNTYLIQAIVGLAITIPLSLLVIYKDKLFAGAGVLLAFGFGQGPGQALNNGNILHNEHPYFAGSSFGLAVATIGFLVACIVGVIYINVAKKKGRIRDNNCGFIDEKTSNEKDIIPISESVDRLTVQLALVFVVYAFSYLFLFGLEALCNTGILGGFGKTVSDLFYGFNFLIGTAFAMVAKKIISLLKKSGAMKHTHTDNYLLSRISGTVFDIMILATIAAIDFDKLEGLWLPLIAICTVGALLTFIYLKFICKRIYRGYEEEGFVSMFGMLTGTASTGTILLREIDPEFKTPASYNLIMQPMPSILFGFPILLIVGYLKKDVTACIVSLAILAVLFVAFNLFILFDFKKKGFVKRGEYSTDTTVYTEDENVTPPPA